VCAKDHLAESYGLPKGSCVPADQVLVVDPSLCQDTGPIFCTPKQALDRLSSRRRYVIVRRSARESDFADIEVGRFESPGLDLHLIGPLADGSPVSAGMKPAVHIGMAGRRGFIVRGGTKATLEGFLIHRSDLGIYCNGQAGTETQVRVVRSLIANNTTGFQILNECRLVLEESWVGRGPAGVFGDLPGNLLAFHIEGGDFDIRNSVIADNGDLPRRLFGGLRVRSLSTGAGGKRMSSIVNSLFYGQLAWINIGDDRVTSVMCDGPINNRLVVLNTSFFQDPEIPLYDRNIAANCNAAIFNVATDEQALSGSGVVYVPRGQSPGFRAAKQRDFHLAEATTELQRRIREGGAVRVTAFDKGTFSAPEGDLDGRPRPLQSNRVSIGPYEP
jgi:hypothetical protein